MRLWLAGLAVAALAACAGKATWDTVNREVYVVTLPHGAEVTFEGAAAGTTPVAVTLPPTAAAPGPLSLRIDKAGFRPEVRTFPSDAPPDRLVAVLVPELEGVPAEPPELDDVAGLHAIGAALAADARCAEAVEYLDRVLALAPRHAPAHRALGDCFLALGEPHLAVNHLARYLLLVPDAADAAEVQARLDGLRAQKDIDLALPPRE